MSVQTAVPPRTAARSGNLIGILAAAFLVFAALAAVSVPLIRDLPPELFESLLLAATS